MREKGRQREMIENEKSLLFSCIFFLIYFEGERDQADDVCDL